MMKKKQKMKNRNKTKRCPRKKYVNNVTFQQHKNSQTRTRRDNGPFPFYMKFEKIQNSQKYHHSLKEHPMFSKIAKFGCKML